MRKDYFRITHNSGDTLLSYSSESGYVQIAAKISDGRGYNLSLPLEDALELESVLVNLRKSLGE